MLYSPSLACADLLNMEHDIRCLIDGGMNMVHLDVMDGHYVPNLSLNLDLIRGIRSKFPEIKLDVHLMVTNPMEYVKPLAGIGTEYVTFHIDATSFAHRLITSIREAGMRPGISVNPSDHLCLMDPVLDLVDMVLLMSVEPGFSGQQFIPSTYMKIHSLARRREEKGIDFIISMDGGIDIRNGRECAQMGADCLVLGVFAVFNQPQGITQACRDFISKVKD